MKLNFFFFLLVVALTTSISACKTCNECRVARQTTVNDSLVFDTINPYPEICGSNRDLKAFEDRCNIEFSSAEGDVTQYKCLCTKVD